MGGGRGGAVGEEGGPRWGERVLAQKLAPIKSAAGWDRASDCPRSDADRHARHGAHLPGAALRPAAEPVRPQGRLQVC